MRSWVHNDRWLYKENKHIRIITIVIICCFCWWSYPYGYWLLRSIRQSSSSSVFILCPTASQSWINHKPSIWQAADYTINISINSCCFGLLGYESVWTNHKPIIAFITPWPRIFLHPGGRWPKHTCWPRPSWQRLQPSGEPMVQDGSASIKWWLMLA